MEPFYNGGSPNGWGGELGGTVDRGQQPGWNCGSRLVIQTEAWITASTLGGTLIAASAPDGTVDYGQYPRRNGGWRPATQMEPWNTTSTLGEALDCGQ